MRRILHWYLPTAATLAGIVLFGYGLVAFARGDLGVPLSDGARFAASPTPAVKQDELRMMILGDSLARGTGDVSGLGIGGNLDAELGRMKRKRSPMVNVAVNGARTRDLLKLLDSRNVQKLIGDANVVVVSIGGNDLFGDAETRSNPPANPDAVIGRVLDSVVEVVGRIRTANPAARIFLVGLYNPFTGSDYGKLVSRFVNRWNGELVRRFEGDADLTVVQTSDLFSHSSRLSLDRFHPGEEGYRLIANRIANSL
ncbi:MAG TPA: GDSL-type esterase/lipase family protein [Thermoanaerobaculia bacterium]|nr:GDSL-type esterase/lipase family protein [Thermoanaerobaculia bacterium]